MERGGHSQPGSYSISLQIVCVALVITASSSTLTFYVSEIVFIDTKQCSTAMQNICATAATAPMEIFVIVVG